MFMGGRIKVKRNLLKAIGISFLIFVILSWIIPVGTYSGGKLSKDSIDAVGLFDLVGVPVQTMLTFILYAVVFATIGGLYGVMSKTGALEGWTSKTIKKYEGKEKSFVVFTIIFFTILSSLTGLVLPLFVLVPLFAIILFGLGFDKVTSLASTVGAILVGSIGSTYGFNITGMTVNLLPFDTNKINMSIHIMPRIIMLVILTAILIFFVLKHSTRKKLQTASLTKEEHIKTVKKEEKKATKTTTKKPTTKKTTRKTTKKTTKNLAVVTDVKTVNNPKSVSTLPLIVILFLMMIIIMVGMYNWFYSFKIGVFNDFHDTIMKIKISGLPIFEHLLSGIGQIGYWGNNELIVIIVISSMLIAFIYRLSFGQYVESFIAGVKKMMPTAIYATLASVILTVLYQASYNGTGTLVTTLFSKTMQDSYNAFGTGLSALYGSFFYNDIYSLLSAIQPFVADFGKGALKIAGITIQSMYALGMLIFPTSVILIAGLSYFDVSYKNWLKYIWKFALLALIVILATCLILTAI